MFINFNQKQDSYFDSEQEEVSVLDETEDGDDKYNLLDFFDDDSSANNFFIHTDIVFEWSTSTIQSTPTFFTQLSSPFRQEKRYLLFHRLKIAC